MEYAATAPTVTQQSDGSGINKSFKFCRIAKKGKRFLRSGRLERLMLPISEEMVEEYHKKRQDIPRGTVPRDATIDEQLQRLDSEVICTTWLETRNLHVHILLIES